MARNNSLEQGLISKAKRRGAEVSIRRQVVPVILAVALVAAPAASPAAALDPPAGRSRSLTVDFSDLNPDSEPDARILLQRLRKAASNVCGGMPAPFELWRRRPYRDCVNDAMRRAVTELNRPLVTWLYERETTPELEGRPSPPPR